MATIRIIERWKRSPSSGETHRRVVMVVADSWGEQRVLMNAYAKSADREEPTICIEGLQLPIGPAGVDSYGHWGLHIEVEGRAEEFREKLETAAKRLAGSKGRPPRLADESPRRAFRKKRVTRQSGTLRTSVPIKRVARQSGVLRIAVPRKTTENLASLLGRTMPLGFSMSAEERSVLETLGKQGRLTASEVAIIAGATDGTAWMESFMARLANHGLDLIVVADTISGDPTFALRG